MPSYKISEVDTSKRLDIFIAEHLTELSRSSIQKLINDERVWVNGQPQKTGYKLKVNDSIRIDFDTKEISVIPDIDLPIIYEDDDCIVINKPAGILTHSKGVFNPEATVASFIKNKISFPDELNRDGIVHRLDRGTSGVIICAKNPEVASWLQKQFAQRKVKKTYIAIVQGHMKPSEAIIDMPIERNPQKPQTFRVGINGKAAKTHYKTLQKSEDYSLIELKPETGRTHQLRVHLEHRGNPILGDVFYGGKEADRLYLHARQLELTLPSRERKIFSVEVPSEFIAKMKQ